MAGRVFTAFWPGDGGVLAGMHANDRDAISSVRRLVGHRVDERARTDETTALAEVPLQD
ncbi:MAG: hypothetical protein ACR2FG_14365 [Marmoricola sp.]